MIISLDSPIDRRFTPMAWFIPITDPSLRSLSF
jgi:hypothetical protein